MKRVSAAVLATAFLVLSFAQSAPAQKRARQQQRSRQQGAEVRELKREIESLREEQQGIREELEEIRKLLRELAENPGRGRQQYVSVDDDPSLGESTAGVVLIDFSDYQ